MADQHQTQGPSQSAFDNWRGNQPQVSASSLLAKQGYFPTGAGPAPGEGPSVRGAAPVTNFYHSGASIQNGVNPISQSSRFAPPAFAGPPPRIINNTSAVNGPIPTGGMPNVNMQQYRQPLAGNAPQFRMNTPPPGVVSGAPPRPGFNTPQRPDFNQPQRPGFNVQQSGLNAQPVTTNAGQPGSIAQPPGIGTQNVISHNYQSPVAPANTTPLGQNVVQTGLMRPRYPTPPQPVQPLTATPQGRFVGQMSQSIPSVQANMPVRPSALQSPMSSQPRTALPRQVMQPNTTGNAPPIASAPPPLPVLSGGSAPQQKTSTQPPSGFMNGLPVPFHGQGQYTHQIGVSLQSPSTPEPNVSQKSSRSATPIVSQNYDALEGGMPMSSQSIAQPITVASMPPLNTTNVAAPHGPAGRRQYPQMSDASSLPPYSHGPPTHPPGISSFSQPSWPLPPTQMTGPPFATQPPGSLPPTRPFGSFPPPPTQPLGSLPAQRPTHPPMPPSQSYTGSGPAMPPYPAPGQQPLYSAPGQQPPYSAPGQQPPYSAPGQQPPYSAPGQQPPYSAPGQPGYPHPNQPSPYELQSPNYATNSIHGVNAAMTGLGLQEGPVMLNLLQERRILPVSGIETPQPQLQQDFRERVNCHPDVFRCTLNAIPQTAALLNKSRLPLGILIHPFKDLSQLPVIQSSVIVRCRSCRTYINPFVYFESDRNWKCNLCYRVNSLPEEFSFDPVSKTYGDPQRRPEIKSATIEFIAPSEYMLRPPQPAVYIYLLDVSFNAVETGYLNVLCDTLTEEIDKIPGDSRTQIGFIAYDSVLRYFSLSEGLSQPQMLVISDIEDIFLPCPDGLLANLHESRDLVIDLLSQIPTLFRDNKETSSALGAALQAAHKLMGPTGGRISVFQTILPTAGPGALQPREDPNLRASKKVENLGPATDFYKRLALECSAQQIAVDLFMLNGQYADIATLACISKYSGGCLHHYPSFHSVRNPAGRDKFELDLQRYITRKIGFESVMRIRCTKGLSIHTFHGNFFVRSTDLLSLPNINPDTGFGMQMSIEDSLTDSPNVCFQAALLYTSSKGERRIRVHTLCVPITNNLGVVFAQADQFAITSLVSKMAVDRSVSSTIGDAKEAIITSAVDALEAYGNTLTASLRIGTLHCPSTLRMLALYMSSLLKSVAFRTGVSTRLDDRVVAMEQLKTLPLKYHLQKLYPTLYPVHSLDDQNVIKKGDHVIPNPPQMQLSSSSIDRHGVFLLDAVDEIVVLVGAAVSDQFCQDVFDLPNYSSLPESLDNLPEMDNAVSERLRTFVTYLLDRRPHGATFTVVREDSKDRHMFFNRMVEDRTESTMSYYEFLQYIQKKIKT